MALGQFAINFGDMDMTTQRAKQQAQQITALLDQMNSTILSHTSHWTGGAATEFQQIYAECHRAAESLPSALDAAAGTLSTISEGTKDTELANTRRFARS